MAFARYPQCHRYVHQRRVNTAGVPTCCRTGPAVAEQADACGAQKPRVHCVRKRQETMHAEFLRATGIELGPRSPEIMSNRPTPITERSLHMPPRPPSAFITGGYDLYRPIEVALSDGWRAVGEINETIAHRDHLRRLWRANLTKLRREASRFVDLLVATRETGRPPS
jgi:hypothetical protein